MDNALWVTNKKKTDSSSPIYHQLWVAPQLEVGDPGSPPFYAVVLTGLILCRSVQEALVTVSSKLQMSCPEDIVLKQSSLLSGSYNLSIPS